MIYANLTNGIEPAIQSYDGFKVVRIQSTYLEQHHWQKLLDDLDYGFLMDLSLGEEVLVVDGKQKSNKETRAIWQGIPFIRYVLNRRWLDINEECYFKIHKVNNYVDHIYRQLDFRKIDYFQTLACSSITLQGVSVPTNHDGDKEYYFNLLRRYNHEKAR